MKYIVSPNESILDEYKGNYEKVLISQFDSPKYTILQFQKLFNNSLDYFLAILELCKKNDVVVFSKDVLFEEKLFHPHENIDFYRMSMSIANFYSRVSCYNFLKENCNNPVTSSIFGGDWTFWNLFVSFYRYLQESDYIEQRQLVDDLVLNLFLSSCNIRFNHE